MRRFFVLCNQISIVTVIPLESSNFPIVKGRWKCL